MTPKSAYLFLGDFFLVDDFRGADGEETIRRSASMNGICGMLGAGQLLFFVERMAISPLDMPVPEKSSFPAEKSARLPTTCFPIRIPRCEFRTTIRYGILRHGCVKYIGCVK